ncbi:hypothetical protein P9112_012088 [Eukaryota sp. TZLM1-RC]
MLHDFLSELSHLNDSSADVLEDRKTFLPFNPSLTLVDDLAVHSTSCLSASSSSHYVAVVDQSKFDIFLSSHSLVFHSSFSFQWGHPQHSHFTMFHNSPLFVTTFPSLSPAVLIYSPLKKAVVSFLTITNPKSQHPLLLASSDNTRELLIGLLCRSQQLFLFSPAKSTKPYVIVDIKRHLRSITSVNLCFNFPINMFFSPNSKSLFVVFSSHLIVQVNPIDGGVSSFTLALPHDFMLDAVLCSPTKTSLLLVSKHSLILYDFIFNKVIGTTVLSPHNLKIRKQTSATTFTLHEEVDNLVSKSLIGHSWIDFDCLLCWDCSYLYIVFVGPCRSFLYNKSVDPGEYKWIRSSCIPIEFEISSIAKTNHDIFLLSKEGKLFNLRI